MKPKACTSLTALAIYFAASAPAYAQYPVKTIRMIVPVGAGAGTDIVSRFIAPPLATALGRQIVIDNRPGVGGNIGAEVAANSPADGYTLMMGYVSQAINMTLYAKPGYDLVRDFAPVAHVVTGPFLLAAHPTVPVKSVKELIALARGRPGQVNVGLAGSGLILAAHLFYNMAGVKMTDVLYRSTPQSLTALLSGEVSIGFLPISAALPQVKSGKLRGLAVTKSQRVAVAPDLPTVAEAGLPGYEATSWYGIMVPAKTPGEIVARLNAETNKALGQPELRAQFASVDFELGGGTAEQFGALIRQDVEKWGKLVRAAGLRPE